MSQILVTHHNIKQQAIFNKNEKIITINFKNLTTTIDQIRSIDSTSIEIYDYTFNPNLKLNETIPVSDHINQTGNNPLIGHQAEITKPFIDISNLYNSKDGVTTRCLGKYYNEYKKNYKYPSTYLCYIAIIARALNKSNLSAYLINHPNDISYE